MNRKQRTNKGLIELRLDLEMWSTATLVMISLPIFWVFIGCFIMTYAGLDKFELPYMGLVSIICFPIAAISGWFAWRTKKQINRDLSRRQEGEAVQGPIFELFIGEKKK